MGQYSALINVEIQWCLSWLAKYP